MALNSRVDIKIKIRCEYDLLLLQLYARTHAARNGTIIAQTYTEYNRA